MNHNLNQPKVKLRFTVHDTSHLGGTIDNVYTLVCQTLTHHDLEILPTLMLIHLLIYYDFLEARVTSGQKQRCKEAIKYNVIMSKGKYQHHMVACLLHIYH